MKLSLKYISDSRGRQKAVQIPIDEWNKLNKEFHKLMEFKKLKIDISEAVKDVRLTESGKKRPRTLNQFLNGL